MFTPPEADRPVRIEFFGDEVESIRKFDPATQRSSNPVDEALLLPLTETPVREDLLDAIHARLSGKRIAGRGSGRAGRPLRRRDGFSRLGVLRSCRGRRPNRFRPAANAAGLARRTAKRCKAEFDHTWSRIEEAHERSEIGNLVRPTDLYFRPTTGGQR